MILVYQTGCLGPNITIDGKRLEDVPESTKRELLRRIVESIPSHSLDEAIERFGHTPFTPPDESEHDGWCEQCGTQFDTERWILPDEEEA